MNFHYGWAYAYGQPSASGELKLANSDFLVTEIPLDTPVGEGEHVWLYIEKDGQNTEWVAKQLAQRSGVTPKDVGYAGRKDRHAITRQWFSIYLPKHDVQTRHLQFDGIKILSSARHSKKLRRGDLIGNHFEITLRNFQSSDDLEMRLAAIARHGVPNYFGDQRFGRDFQNVPTAMDLIARRQIGRRGNDIYLSAARSYIFNTLLSHLVEHDDWQQQTCAMWGRGRPEENELAKLSAHTELLEGLEHTGLKQERRNAQLLPESFSWVQGETSLTLRFVLPAGAFATSVIREIAVTK